jgi:hypothetical protein
MAFAAPVIQQVIAHTIPEIWPRVACRKKTSLINVGEDWTRKMKKYGPGKSTAAKTDSS